MSEHPSIIMLRQRLSILSMELEEAKATNARLRTAGSRLLDVLFKSSSSGGEHLQEAASAAREWTSALSAEGDGK